MLKANFAVSAMHGDMPQQERDSVFKSFREGFRYELFPFPPPQLSFLLLPLRTSSSFFYFRFRSLMFVFQSRAHHHGFVGSRDGRAANIYGYQLRSAEQQRGIPLSLPSPSLPSPSLPEAILTFTFQNYIHRIGRGGRFGRRSVAINFVREEDVRILRDIEQFYGTQIDELPLNFNFLVWTLFHVVCFGFLFQYSSPNSNHDKLCYHFSLIYYNHVVNRSFWKSGIESQRGRSFFFSTKTTKTLPFSQLRFTFGNR